jgi:hypothetical protein
MMVWEQQLRDTFWGHLRRMMSPATIPTIDVVDLTHVI